MIFSVCLKFEHPIYELSDDIIPQVSDMTNKPYIKQIGQEFLLVLTIVGCLRQ